ncbi:PREDICTED: uncharacterized protein LOC109217389 [Nicotiana attenuata]|uniref:Uncharacterized protein n=1 Tax=Nicotiana attenuata TaxID=49451 RepID=A0A1J6KLE9_NICAT|nr:PREDICTED: uncharacterized protein LOC109217389 [Nicotiana attenuata]XP_019237173.1 PREDICTED: uncharacterized protein LOC109217389 [Nicotiana attenuata]OIT22599.1 hypothetical protein A4A49_31021 [Nicotiana attenuata]
MVELCCSMDAAVKTEEEFERLPLKQRLKLLLASKRLLESSNVLQTSIDTFVKKEDEQCDSQNLHSAYSVQQEKLESLALQQNITEKVDTVESSPLQLSLSPKFPINVKVECAKNSTVNSFSNLVNDSSSADGKEINSKKPDDFLDDLDFVVLKERQRILHSRKEQCLKTSILEGKPSNFSSVLMNDTTPRSAGIVKGQLRPIKVIGNGSHEFHRISNHSNAAVGGLSSTDPQVSKMGHHCQRDQLSDSGNSMELLGNGRRTLSKQEDSSRALDLSSFNRKSKVSSPISDLVHVKVEPVDNSMDETTAKNGMGTMPHSSTTLVKTEIGISYDSSGDELDHMLLRERMKLFSSRAVPSFEIGRIADCSRKIVSSVSDCTPISSVPAKPLRVSRPRKRRKTATESVEVAMEEDAPGLLQVLLEKGISVDEIKLYGENQSNEPLDDLTSEDSFSELEAVISKLFSQRQSLLKLAPLQCTKGEKASYCLACLFSLVEQARYLHFRKWPVEWGWCRDLQSFIFVFERHNRIVLERPEYGYATYFFELVDSTPIDWQIRRLVTAMKLTSCSRVNLIENRTLAVGEELSEGEARVLMAYGWVPNTGLGTMLNYCDRVFHDRKTEKDISEWRSKIGQLLIDGYNGGSLVGKTVDFSVALNCPQIKLELD